MVVFLGPKDVAARLGISERGAARLMKRGEIPSFRAGVKPWRTTDLHLEGYAIRRTLEGTAAFPPLPRGSSFSGLPQSHVEVIPRRVSSQGLVIRRGILPKKAGPTLGNPQRKPA